jgi:hypothetical protein
MNGVIEAGNEKDNLLSEERLEPVLRDASYAQCADLVKAVAAAVRTPPEMTSKLTKLQ